MDNNNDLVRPDKKNTVWIALSIIVAGILIAGALVYTPSDKPFAVPKGDPRTVTLSTDDDTILGDPKAPVTMIIFGDYECPFCERQATGVEEQIKKDYVETGKVKLVYRDFPLENIHKQARPAAIAAECAGEQGAYWPYHDLLFANHAKLSIGNVDYVALASSLKLDAEAFKICLSNPAIDAEVSKDLEDGVSLGIRGTPASFINNVFVEGAYPYAAFAEVIEAELKE